MDLEIHEALALSDDRSAALGQLLPGSEDHDFYRALAAQHRGALDEVDEILRQWPERHGHTQRFEQLRLRQLLYRVSSPTPTRHDDVRDWLGVSHWHEAEVEEVDPTRPTRLAEGTFDGNALLQQAIDYDSNLSQVTDEGLLELVARPMDPSRRRVLLSRLGHTPQPELVQLVVEELSTRGSGGFGSLAVHAQLTLAQLDGIARVLPQLRGHHAWVGAVLRRMRPYTAVDVEIDREARLAYLQEAWKFVADLPPATNTFKAHVLWHLLDTLRRRSAGPVDAALVRAYLSLPRHASYLAHKWIERVKSDEVAHLGQDLRDITGFGPAGSDEDLVRDLLQRRIADAEQYAQWLERAWLDTEIATATLLFGDAGSDRATLTLGPARAAALRDRIELQWCTHAPVRVGAADPVSLDVDVKNVGELVVKVFRIDPLAYFQHHKREVNTDLDLDGLAASHEMTIKIGEPAVRRVRRTIDLPMCARPGTYVVDLIGNGMSSRALVEKGRLRHVVRVGAAGHVVTMIDEGGTPLAGSAGARAWIGEREYVPDDRGQFVVAFSTSPSRVPMLLSCGDVATVNWLDLKRETYHLGINLLLDREALASARTAKAIARVALHCAEMPASLALLKRTTWDVTLTDRHGVSTTKSQPLALDDDGAAVLEWPMGEDTAAVTLAVRGVVEVKSEQREQELADARSYQLATIHGGTSIEALYCAHTSAGYVISALGKSGEPRAQRPVTVTLTHRWARTQCSVELATDAQGRVELGHLPGVSEITVTLGGLTQRWPGTGMGVNNLQNITVGKELVVAIGPGYSAAEVARRISLIERRAGAPSRHPTFETELLDGAIAIRGLPRGDYELTGPGVHGTFVVTPPGPEVGAQVIGAGEFIETPRPPPVVAKIDTTDALRVQLRGASPKTRVHVIATRFQSSLVEQLHVGPKRAPIRRFERTRPTLYVSGRELGDEYRYVLERRGQKRHPGLLLDKPSLLLNPWSRRTTTTDVAHARDGRAFAGMAAPAPAGAYQSQGYGGGGGAVTDAAFASHDFLPEPTVVLANLAPDASGLLEIPRAQLGSATGVTILVDDPAGSSVRRAFLPERPLAPKDLRLKLALAPERHATQRKAIHPLIAGAKLAIEDLATAKVHLIDTVERAHGYLLALRDDTTLREFSFVTRWHTLADAQRRELYSKYACHELHLFLRFKDRPFFDEVVRPYLAHKRVKTFLDHWLLDADLSAYLEPALRGRLNAVERALLAHRLAADDNLARVLGDQVAILPPDPSTDTRLIDAVLGASALDADSSLARMQSEAYEAAEAMVDMPVMPKGMAGFGPPPAAAAPASRAAVASPRRAPMKKAAKRDEAAKEKAADKMMAGDEDEMDDDVMLREEAKPHFRAVDKTQEWAENNWWHLTPAQSGPDMIRPNRLWRDLARHRAETNAPFLSAAFGLATGSFAEAMCALAVLDLPFVAGAHAYVSDGPRLTITAASNALAGCSQIVDGELLTGGAPLVVGTSYVRTDDRYEWETGEQRDKYVDGPFAVGVVYTCQIVLANPTSSRQRIAALVQIPRGSLPVAGARITHTLDIVLEAYGTHGHEYAFYFPATGAWSHFPVHVTRADQIVAAAPPRTLEVTSGGGARDPRSWPFVSQRGSIAEVVAFLETSNIAAIDTTKVAWRMRDRAAFDAILAALDKRREYCATLWAYALMHRDPVRLRVYLRSLGEQLLAAGPVIDMLDVDGEALGSYEHLELSPLINARAHRLGSKLRILNDGLAAQYQRFLDLVAHRKAPTSEDLLAAAHYLIAQDRPDDALAILARVRTEAIADRMQHDYLAAYLACIVGDLGRAREAAQRWREHPVDRWRHKFGALAAMLDEVQGGSSPAIVDPRSRDQQHAELAAKQPSFDIALDREGITIHSQHVQDLELRFFEMDVELLFSRQPFVQSDITRFSFIEPGHRLALGGSSAELSRPYLAPEHRVAWPAALRGKNVVVEAVGAGQRKAKIHYANDLAATVANQVGQVRVQRVSDRSALVATYVKVYARKHGGAVAFYKDGYTDLRGWFDYASLSTTDLDQVERFAILVCSDQAGASILEANPPVR